MVLHSNNIKEPPYPKPIVAWFVVGMLIVAAIVSFIDRQIIAIVVDYIKYDLAVGDAQIGWLYGIFAIFYALAGFPIAWLSDHKSRKHIIAVGVFFLEHHDRCLRFNAELLAAFPGPAGDRGGRGHTYARTDIANGRLFPARKNPIGAQRSSGGPNYRYGDRCHYWWLGARGRCGCRGGNSALFWCATTLATDVRLRWRTGFGTGLFIFSHS